MKNIKIITLSNGAQFHGGNAAYLFVLFITLLVLFLAFIVNGIYLGIVLVFPIMLFLGIYTLDIRGIQINLAERLIRQYKQKLGGKKGNWIELDKYETIILNHEFYKIKNAQFQGLDMEISSSKTTHGHFVVRLISTKHKESFIIVEELNYSTAKKVLAQIAKSTGFEVKDLYHEKLTHSINMRSWN